jgi:hypothetical protein
VLLPAAAAQFAGSGAPLDVDAIATEKDDGQGSKV